MPGLSRFTRNLYSEERLSAIVVDCTGIVSPGRVWAAGSRMILGVSQFSAQDADPGMLDTVSPPCNPSECSSVASVGQRDSISGGGRAPQCGLSFGSV